MDVAKKEDVLLLADEKFDFDLSLSSSSANEDDEVFFGPVGHRERCIAASLELNNQVPAQPASAAPASACTWSPLTGEKFVEVYKEAHLLALQIESQSRTQAAPVAQPEQPWSQGVEKFLQESKLKMSLFEKEEETEKSPKSLKRETYYLSDSPLVGTPLSQGQLPSAKPLLPAPGPASPAAAGQHSSHALTRNPQAAHPLGQAVPQKRVPSKLPPPRASSAQGRHLQLASEKLKKEVPASPSQGKLLNEKQPRGAGLPEKPRASLDAASLPGTRGHRGQGKRSLLIPSKVGLKRSLLKPLGCAGSIPGKSSSSSSSSSSSGFSSSTASSVCPSPAAGKGKSSELASVPATGAQPLPSTGKPGGPGPAILRQALPAAPAGASSVQARGIDAVWSTAPPTAPPAQPRTPESGGARLNPGSVSSASSELNKTQSLGRRDSCLNSRMKAVPTPTDPFKIPRFSIGGSPNATTLKFSRAQRLQSWASAGRVVVHSTPVRRSSGPASQSPSGSTRTPTSVRRMSALPTPASRRLSGLPLMTPRTMPRALASPLFVPARRLSSEPRRGSAVGTEPARDSGQGPGRGQLASSPRGVFSPPPSVPQALCFSPEQSSPSSEDLATGPAQDEAKSKEDTHPAEVVDTAVLDRPPLRGPAPALLVDIGLDQLAISPAESRAPEDLPLIDLGSTPGADVSLGPASGPLIDLTANTPDMSRHDVSKAMPAEGQLIDLCSPLIQLSPEADKENLDSPLLRF